MPHVLLLFFFSVILHTGCISQRSVFISAEVGWSDDHYKMDDPGGRFDAPSLGSGLFGIAVRKMISSHLYLETGLYTREYHQGLAFKNELSSSGTGRRFLQIPMRVGVSLPLFNGRLLVRPAGGLAFNGTGNYDESSSWGSVSYPGETIDYSYKILYQTQAFFLAQTSCAMEFRIGRHAYLGLSSTYNWGLEKIHLQDIRYSINGGPEMKAIASTRGGYFSIGGTFSYRLSK